MMYLEKRTFGPAVVGILCTLASAPLSIGCGGGDSKPAITKPNEMTPEEYKAHMEEMRKREMQSISRPRK